MLSRTSSVFPARGCWFRVRLAFEKDFWAILTLACADKVHGCCVACDVEALRCCALTGVEVAEGDVCSHSIRFLPDE